MISYVLLALILILLIFLFSRFNPAATGKIKENLYVVRSVFVNFYILVTSDGLALFDTGMSPGAAVRGFKKLGLDINAVKYIFLTHTDYDHAGGIKAFPKAVLYISKAEVPMIDGSKARRGLMYNRRLSSYRTLDNNETVQAGDTKIQLIFTPGHTAGSASYLIDNKTIVTGDLLRLSRKGAILPFLWLMNMDHRQDKESLKAVWPIIEKADYILTAHTGFISRGERGIKSFAEEP